MTKNALQALAARLVFPRLGSNMNPPITADEDLPRFESLLASYPFGGLVLFNGNKDTTPRLLAALQASAKTPLLIASDIERGAGQQMKGATLFPHAMAVGRAGAEAVTAFAEITAREALACGIHIAFAPVADVNSNPRNPIIGIRAFGVDSGRVSRDVAAFVRTCRRHGLLTTAKHFPGHGNTAADSHAELPRVTSSRSILEEVDLPPFEAAIRAGVELVMTAHVSYPALDPVVRPATASPPILTGLLRERSGFRGAIVTDSLIMGAIHSDDTTRLAADLLNAGVDILLDPPDPVALVQGIVRAVQQGLTPRERLHEACERIETLRASLTDRFGASYFTSPYRSLPAEEIGAPAHRDAARAIARRALQSEESNAMQPLRIPIGPDTLAVLIQPYRTHLDPPLASLGEFLNAHTRIRRYAEVDAETPDDRLQALLQEARESTSVLAAVVSKPAAWRSFSLPEKLTAFLDALVPSAPTLLVSLGDPSILEAYPRAAQRLCAYSDVPASQEALALLLT